MARGHAPPRPLLTLLQLRYSALTTAAKERSIPPLLHSLVLVRHGETEWSTAGRHTGRTDLSLTARGQEQARAVANKLAGRSFARVFSSPLHRAAETCALAGFGAEAEALDDLMEWDYGALEGLTSNEIRATRPGWTIWSGDVPGGESAAAVAARADRVVTRVREVRGDVLLFAHGHLLRVLVARWLGLEPQAGRLFALDTATVSVLGWERDQATIRQWNVGP